MSNTTVPPHNTPQGFTIRAATSKDADEMGDLFFTSFTPSHKFWQVMLKDNDTARAWWSKAWKMGIEEDPSTRTFVVADTSLNNKLVAFSRWVVPQSDGNLERLWPDLNEDYDPEISAAFFGGMEENRQELMGKRPHWMLEMLGVDQHYQQHGLGAALIAWGLRQADQQSLETYLDGSMKGRPFYERRGFEFGKDIPLPVRPESYGKFVYTSMVRPPQIQTA